MMELSDFAAQLPPPGKTSKFVNPPSLRSAIVAFNATLLSLATLFVPLRIYTKGFLTGLLHWSDYIYILKLVQLAIPLYSFMASFEQQSGGIAAYHIPAVNQNVLGRHMWDIPLISITPSVGNVAAAIPIAYGLAILFVKLSVLLLLYQIFAVNKTMRYLIHFGIVFQALFYLAVTGVYSATEVICVTGANITAYLCTHQWPLAIAQGVINAVTDLYVLVLPLAMVMRLQLSPKRKVGIIAIFMTGLLAVVESLARLILTVRHVHGDDLFWNAALTSLLSCCEMNAGIICACMPAMPTFFKHHKLGLTSIKSLRSRLHAKKSSDATKSTGKRYSKLKTFHGISLHLTKPTLSIRTADYSELESIPAK